MSSQISDLARSAGTAKGATELTSSQKDLLASSGLKPGSDEYKQTELKFKVQNLQNAVTMANELLQAFSEMRKKAVEGMRA